jgi:YidC/Oxa1 family membrane protein insertase
MNNQNESSPFGQPKTLVILLFVFLGLFGWQYYLDKKYPRNIQPLATAQPAQDSAGSQNKNEVTAATDPSKTSKNTLMAKSETTEGKAEQKLTFENEKVLFEISSFGFGFSKYQVKDYKDRAGGYITYQPALPLYAVLYKNAPVVFNITKVTDFEYVGEAILEGKKITRKLVFSPEKLSFQSDFTLDSGVESLSIAITKDKLVPKSSSIFFPSFEHQDFVYVTEGKTNSDSISTIKEGEGMLSSADRVSMASIGTQYFTAASINKSDLIPSITKRVEGSTAHLEIIYNLKNTSLTSLTQIYYIGAKKTEILNQIDPQLPEVMNYGIFGFISKPLLKLLVLMHGIFNNWGLALIAMTILVRLLLLPFNVMSFRSAQSMQKIKPKMDKVRELYKNDPMRMNKETMALMKENNANPVSGCLPMLLQIPIFFALWRMISSSVEIYQQPFFGWITDLSSHDQYFILPILMGITMFLQQKLTPTNLDPMQAKILNFMPIIFTLFMLSLPSGLTLYNFISALFGVIQQYIMRRDTPASLDLKAAKS